MTPETTQDGADVVERPSPITPYCESDDDRIFALLCARKDARSAYAAAAIAWAEDEIAELRKDRADAVLLATRLRAENERLREALRDLLNWQRLHLCNEAWAVSEIEALRVTANARAALKEPSNG
jgi:hypothetical protein